MRDGEIAFVNGRDVPPLLLPTEVMAFRPRGCPRVVAHLFCWRSLLTGSVLCGEDTSRLLYL